MFLKVALPFPYNFPVNISLHKVKNNSNTIYLAKAPLLSVSYHFPWCVGCLSSSQSMKQTPLPRCCYCETSGCYAKQEQMHWVASYEHPSKKRVIRVYHLTNLSRRNCIYLFCIHTNIYLQFNLILKEVYHRKILGEMGKRKLTRRTVILFSSVRLCNLY